MIGFTSVSRKARTPRKPQGQTRNRGHPPFASESSNPSGISEGQAKSSVRKAGNWIGTAKFSGLNEEGTTYRNEDLPVLVDRGKGHCVEEPLIVSDKEGSEDEETSEDIGVSGKQGSEECVELDTEDSEDVAAPDEAGTSASVMEILPPDEDNDEVKIEKLSLAFKQQKTVSCLWRDVAYQPAIVLEIKEQPTGCFKYYVHYTEFDRRNDAWVNLKQLDPDFTRSFVENKERSGVMTRRQKRQSGIMAEDDELDAEALREHEALTRVKKINKIRLGKYEMQTWYYSPLPAEYDDCQELFFCEFCLTFLKRESQLKRHMRVDGTKQRVYGENLCYLAKMFLDHKLLLYDVGAFLFYILCEEDVFGFHIVAYFSKEKYSERDNILACILTLPPYQRKGYGNFLIAFGH